MTLEQARQAVKDLRKKLAEYLEQEPCEDAISREATLKPYNGLNDEDTISVWLIRKNIEQQPPVTPQPKTGKWIDSPNGYFTHCSECGLHGDKGIYKHYGWCPKCGARMIELQESENK